MAAADIVSQGDGGTRMKCGYCGSPASEGLRFCSSCGAPLGQTPPSQQTTVQTSVSSVPTTTQQRVQYIPPEEPLSPPPGPDRTLLWIGIAAAAVLIIALAVLIPLLLRGGDEVTPLTSTTGATSTTLAPATTTTVAPTTTIPVAGPVGDSPGSWTEVSVPGGPWAAQEVAVSDEALLIVTTVAAGYKLSAVMLDSGEVVTVSQSEALFGVDLDGLLAVWWEASGWDATTETYANQYIRSRLLPSGAKRTIVSGGPTRMGMPQVAQPWVTWVLSEPWATSPDEYWTERIMGTKVDGSGSQLGSPVTMVPSALAFALGDSGWQYSLSGTSLAWQHGTTAEGYDVGTHVMHTDTSGHQWIGADAWRPTLWEDLLVYQDGSLKVTDLAADETRVIDPSGDFATAGPTFAAYYKPSSSGSYLVARGYGGAHEQTLDELSQPPYFCPVASVSDNYIAYAFEEQIRLFKWQPE
jgi:hypothetical protein